MASYAPRRCQAESTWGPNSMHAHPQNAEGHSPAAGRAAVSTSAKQDCQPLVWPTHSWLTHILSWYGIQPDSRSTLCGTP